MSLWAVADKAELLPRCCLGSNARRFHLAFCLIFLVDCTIWATGIGLAFLLFLRRLVGYYSTAHEESGHLAAELAPFLSSSALVLSSGPPVLLRIYRSLEVRRTRSLCLVDHDGTAALILVIISV